MTIKKLDLREFRVCKDSQNLNWQEFRLDGTHKFGPAKVSGSQGLKNKIRFAGIMSSKEL